MTKYKLIYFPIKGRAEPIRLIFAYAGVDYEDYRMKEGEWPTLKDKTPTGQVPLLEVDGKMLPQSMTICRYLAKKFGLTGKDDWESAQCDVIADTTQDTIVKLFPWFKEKDEEKKKALLVEIGQESIKPYAEFLAKTLKASGSGFYVGNQLTWSDLSMLAMEEWFCAMFPDVMNAHPEITKHKDMVSALPNVKKWLETRPKTDM